METTQWAFVKGENWKDRQACEFENWGKGLWRRKIMEMKELQDKALHKHTQSSLEFVTQLEAVYV